MKTLEEKRKENNERLIEQVKSGTFIPALIDHQAAWWAPRPIIEKAQKEIDRVYNPEKK